MRARALILILLPVIMLLPHSVVAQESRPPVDTATLPLSEVLKLYRELEETRRKPEPGPPPIPAAIHRLELTGRLLDTGVDLGARFEIVVLSDDEWVSLPLLKQDAATHLSSLPTVNGGAFSVSDGFLSFVTRQKGSYAFQIKLLKRAAIRDRQRSVRIEYVGATVASCQLEIDEGLFRLRGDEALDRPEGVVLFPEGNVFAIEWERRADAVVKKETAPRPAIESVIPSAHASTVSTLEGKRITRVRYDLRFTGTQSIEIEIPDGLAVERVFLNGLSTDLKPEGRVFPVEVAPAREGDEAAVLELVLTGSSGGYLLSGLLEFSLPRVSWPVNEIFLDVRIPAVFNYTWTGGSLAPVEDVPRADYSYRLPLPGKKLTFHQSLITSSAPNVSLEYAVDLEGRYYR
jgi:hypothetical protein